MAATPLIQAGVHATILTDGLFCGPDGRYYRGAFGPVNILKAEDLFGFTPKSPSTNWYAQIGYGEKAVLIAGCQIHHALLATTLPATSDIFDARD